MAEREDHYHETIVKKQYGNRHGGALYGMGILGAAVYYIQGATNLSTGALGLLKAFFWPALIVHKVFQTLQL